MLKKYDIRSSANACKTLVELSGVDISTWEKYVGHEGEYIYTDDLGEDVINTYGQIPKNYFDFDYEWFTSEYADQEEFRRWKNSFGALLLLHKSINASLNDSKYDYKLSKYCSNEGNIYTESLGDQAYQNNPKFKKFIADKGLGFKPYAQFGKAEITERIQLLVQLVNLVWNTEMFV